MVCALAGCGGGEDIDFSAPTAGVGVGVGGGERRTGLEGLAPPPSKPKAEPAKTTAKTAEPAAKANPGAKAGLAEESGGDKMAVVDKAAGSKSGKPAPKKKFKLTRSASKDRDRRNVEEDEEANWREEPFQLSPRMDKFYSNVGRAAFSASGNLLATVDESNEILLFATRYGDVKGIYRLSNPRALPRFVAISEKDELLLVSDKENNVSIFELRDLSQFDRYARAAFQLAQRQRPPYALGDEPLSMMKVIAGDKFLLTVTKAGEIHLRPIQTRPQGSKSTQWEPSIRIKAHESQILDVAISDDGTRLISSADNGSVRVWRIADGTMIAEMPPCTVPATAVAVLKDSYAVGRANGITEIWADIDTEEPSIAEYAVTAQMEITDLQVEPKRGLLVRTLSSGAVSLVDLHTEKMLGSRRSHPEPILALSSSADQTRILSCGLEGEFGSWPPPELRERSRRQQLDEDQEDEVEALKPKLKFHVATFVEDEDTEDSAGRYNRIQRAQLLAFRNGEDSIGPDPERSKLESEFRRVAEADRADLREKLGPVEVPKPISATGPRQIFGSKIDADFTLNTRIRLGLSDLGETVTLSVSPPKGRRTKGSLRVWDVESGLALREWDVIQVYEDLRILHGGRWVVPVSEFGGQAELNPPNFYDIKTGIAKPAPSAVRHISPDGGLISMTGRYGETLPTVVEFDENMEPLKAFEEYESVVPAMARVKGSEEIVLSVRERLRSRLIVVDSNTMNETQAVSEYKTVPWVEANGRQLDVLGTTDLLVSENGKLVITHGRYETQDYRFVIWKRSSKGYREEDAIGSPRKSNSYLLDGVVGPRMVFANGGKEIVLLTPEGLVEIAATTGKPSPVQQLPSTLSRFSPDGQWLATHDGSGGIELRRIGKSTSTPRTFRAHRATVLGFAFNSTGTRLATIGEERELKVWDLATEWDKEN